MSQNNPNMELIKIIISVRLPDDTVFNATASSFERATEELAAIERKIEKITGNELEDASF